MTPKKIKVLFILPSLRAGGAERVISFVANNLNRATFDVSLVIIESETDKAYELHNVTPVFLNKKRTRNAILSLFNYILKNRPDVVVSSIGQINTTLSLYAIFFRNIKFITRETYVRGTNFKRKNSGFFGLLGSFQKITIDKVICQSMDIYQNLIDNYGFKKEQLVVINNPITSEFHLQKKKEKIVTEPKLITIGRLEKQKGYARVLHALAKLDIPYKYTIIGSGSLENEIFEIARSLNIHNNIEHIPFTKNIQEHLINSDLYLQGSYYEGFPNALLESCSAGTPVLAFNAPGGINEIVLNGINGYRVDTETEFLSKLKILIENMPDPNKVKESVMSRYSQDKILAKYEQLLSEIVN